MKLSERIENDCQAWLLAEVRALEERAERALKTSGDHCNIATTVSEILEFEARERLGLEGRNCHQVAMRLVEAMESAELRALSLESDRDALLASLRRCGEALMRLTNEAQGLEAFEDEVRAAIGDTDWAALELRVTEARAALAQNEVRRAMGQKP